ncbi:pseudouridine synthase [Geobacter pickeringii]|uniref:tRNA pseudouridine synthase C n=1 Tax=Geobacter pickeringii TaxID=345632 RepID=A0A0B5B711_9BACT|nr:pseudouridine synthase [Geobacter pickeringii]AJE02308.1 pseudouridylate synthase [Geobacter pickeringii]
MSAPAIAILHRDDHLVAVAKPAGLLVHRSPIDRHETRFALQEVRDLLRRHVYPVHRLDKPTSGLLLFALTPEAARSLTDAFAAGAVAKRYLAVARGIVPDDGVIDHPLTEEPDRFDGTEGANRLPREAVTLYRRLAATELPVATGRYPTSRYSLVLLEPKTGRRHQLRRHLKHLRHPIIGDTTHGEGRHNRLFREQFACGRLLLHAAELTLPHPASGRAFTISAPIDAGLLALFDRLGWRDAVPPQWLPPAP